MRIAKLFAGFAGLLTATGAHAQAALDNLEIIGKPNAETSLSFQPAVTELARDLHWLDQFVFVIITVITLFVTALLLWCAYRFNAKRNPNAATFTHHSTLEVAWTMVPVIILVIIGAFSVPVLFKQQRIPEGDIVIKATGYQWYWGYEYVDHGFGFDSIMIGAGENRLTPDVEAELVEAGYSKDEFLLATDTAVVVPVNKTIVMQVTGADVIHSWTIPAFGVKQDAVPGRLAALWFKAEKEGIYFGQCSELCGQAHAYMPITVKVVSQEVYDAWLEGAIEEYAGTPLSVQVASAN
ncbi:cytochrome c oxidase subunit 2 [Litoreibacter ascidiaceicola]|uniref:Cytochrome c oxidase subunit 2 n=1 Tax=Litoreibacter ascidiaceicola TaxID=1486859 RepID=A0A1M4Y2C4_9RHOB|nr:cytochrome c oxidase subunit II [Litoreibacter ascidiaceicola]SHE99838.1 cytochrome c oxidase subunit 2 [Litoreibacter ascidiaceicola]